MYRWTEKTMDKLSWTLNVIFPPLALCMRADCFLIRIHFINWFNPDLPW
jgi:hypothetical protein